jgi:hypothetical protein
MVPLRWRPGSRLVCALHDKDAKDLHVSHFRCHTQWSPPVVRQGGRVRTTLNDETRNFRTSTIRCDM